MSTKIMIFLAVLIACLLVVSVSAIAAAPAAPAATYTIDWWTVDGGGGGSSGGVYALNGTSGQADAQISSGGIYVLSGGFWNEGVVSPYRIYLPLIRK
jgi:ABC-type transport system substrate-binding protein